DDSTRLEIHALVRQGVAGADPAEMRSVHQRIGGAVYQSGEASIYDDTNLGILLGTLQQGEIIDLLRSKEIFSRAGATEFTLPPNGRIQWLRVTEEMDAYRVGEMQPVSDINMGMGALNMAARKLGAITTWSNELMRFSSPSTEAIIRNELAMAMAKRVDVDFLTGTGSELQPKGLINYSGL